MLKRLWIGLAALAITGIASSQALYNQIPFYPGSSYTAVAPAAPAATSVKATGGYVLHVSCFNLLATPVYIKLFNVVSTSVALGTTSANLNLMCPGNTAGAGFVTSFAWPVSFGTAISYAVTGGISLTDDTAITASSVIVNIVYE